MLIWLPLAKSVIKTIGLYHKNIWRIFVFCDDFSCVCKYIFSCWLSRWFLSNGMSRTRSWPPVMPTGLSLSGSSTKVAGQSNSSMTATARWEDVLWTFWDKHILLKLAQIIQRSHDVSCFTLQVTDFAWSHDGRMALICYRDGFVLVGSVAGQRYWSSVLNLDNTTIACGVWSPDDQKVWCSVSDQQN